jgi:hypothetical protein
METNEIILNASDREFWLLYIPTILWALLVIWFLVRMLRKYTFGKWENSENPFLKETWGMPRGTIRGILSLSLLFYVLLFETLSLTIPSLEKRAGELFTAFGLMIAFYFGSKVMHHLSATDKFKNRDVAAAVSRESSARTQTFADPEAAG